MKGVLRGFAIVALAAGWAAAGPDAEIEALRARLASEDPEIRRAAQEDLGKLLDTAPERVFPVADDADPEVAAAVRSGLEIRGIFRNPEKNARCRELFAKLSEVAPGTADRRPLVDELLALGAPAVTALGRELAAEPWIKIPPSPTRRVDAGGKVAVAIEAKNAGPSALWWWPGSRTVSVRTERLGLRAGANLRFGGRVNLVARSHDSKRVSPEEEAAWALAQFARVPAGATFTVASTEIDMPRCLRFTADLSRTYWSNPTPPASFCERTIVAAPAEVPATAPKTLVALARMPGAGAFSATIVRDAGKRWALELTALSDRPARVPPDPDYDDFWWAAEGAGGIVLATGALRDEAVQDEGWKKGDVRAFPCMAELPSGTKKLWLGYDDGANGPQYVPDPAEVK